MENIMKEMLNEILSIQTTSHNQWRVFAYIIRQVSGMEDVEYYVDNGNIYITKGRATEYPCIVAHMDSVHEIVEDLSLIEFDDNVTGFNRIRMEQTGIGGDDKVGVFIAMYCLYHYDSIKIAFFRDEEIGCVGSNNADVDFFNDCRFVLQCDRRGNSDFIHNASGVQLCSKAFKKAVKKILRNHGYSFANGMMTDVMTLKEIGVECSMANISCGYYNPHMKSEFVNYTDVQNCLSLVMSIIEQCRGSYPHRYTPVIYSSARYPKPVYHSFNWGYGDEKLDSDFITEKNANLYCKDCWSFEPEANGLCKGCNQYYRKEFGMWS